MRTLNNAARNGAFWIGHRVMNLPWGARAAYLPCGKLTIRARKLVVFQDAGLRTR